MNNLESFVHGYAAALTAADIAAIAAAFGPHFVVSSPEGVVGGANDAQFRDVLDQAAGFYRRIGLRSIRVASITAEPLDERHALAKVAWAWDLAGAVGGEPITFDFTYLVRTDGEAPLILAAVAHQSEQAWLRERGLLPAPA